jgi:predicted peptidase
MSRTIVLALLFIVNAAVALAAPQETGFLRRTVQIGEQQRGYRVHVPANFDPERRYPLVLFLHGSYQWGEDNAHHLRFGLPVVMNVGERLVPGLYSSFIGVFPQSRVETPWLGEMADYAMKAVDQTMAEFKTDPERVYVTGFSLGGYGSWYLAAKHPGRFAAIAPLGGNIGVPPHFVDIVKKLTPPEMQALYFEQDPYAAFAKTIGTTPVWIFHGGDDGNVPTIDSRKTFAAMKAAGGNVRYTEYEGADHFIMEQVYTDPAFWTWLFDQRLPRR